jgi:hypothetical protein
LVHAWRYSLQAGGVPLQRWCKVNYHAPEYHFDAAVAAAMRRCSGVFRFYDQTVQVKNVHRIVWKTRKFDGDSG